MAEFKIKDLVFTIDVDDPKSYILEDGKLEIKMHIKGPRFEGDVIIGKWICLMCYELNELDIVHCLNCGMERPGESK